MSLAGLSFTQAVWTERQRGWHVLALMLLLLLGSLVSAQTRVPTLTQSGTNGNASDGNLSKWLQGVHQAARQRAYVGTFVVSAGGYMSSARIWHVCNGVEQMERVESLSGPPRSTFRHNSQVLTFWPERRLAVAEKRESLGLFPDFLQSDELAMARFYRVKKMGSERVAGLDAEVVQLWPEDGLRFGYQVWTERKTGLVIKLQTLDEQGQVLEQSAFSELQLDAPVNMEKLVQMMANTDGYQVEESKAVKTTADAEGWVLKTAVPGFKPMGCHRRLLEGRVGSAQETALQWVFSDGLASVSLFIETYDRRRHAQGASSAVGATHTLTRRVGSWWLTAVGEVPLQTLAIFVQGLERKK